MDSIKRVGRLKSYCHRGQSALKERLEKPKRRFLAWAEYREYRRARCVSTDILGPQVVRAHRGVDGRGARPET